MTTDSPPAQLVARLRAICAAFPEAHEEHAWVGIRWRIRTQTFAHVLTIDDGWPPAYARAAATDGPAHVLMFRSTEAELDMLHHAGHPFFPTPWRHDEIGIHITDSTDWTEIAELLTESYCTQAPKRLAARVRRSDHASRPPGTPNSGSPRGLVPILRYRRRAAGDPPRRNSLCASRR